MCANYPLVYSKYVKVLISKQRYVEISNYKLELSLLGWQAVSKSKHLPTFRSVVCFPDVGSCLPIIIA